MPAFINFVCENQCIVQPMVFSTQLETYGQVITRLESLGWRCKFKQSVSNEMKVYCPNCHLEPISEFAQQVVDYLDSMLCEGTNTDLVFDRYTADKYVKTFIALPSVTEKVYALNRILEHPTGKLFLYVFMEQYSFSRFPDRDYLDVLKLFDIKE